MTRPISTRIRAIGSASVLAITVSMSAGLVVPAHAQSAPDPLVAPPVVNPPAPPANVEECVTVSGVVTCAPGRDADGFFDVSGTALGLDVQEGAFVEAPIIITGAVTGNFDGTIVTTGDFGDALLLGSGSDLTINGFVQTNGTLSEGVETETGSTIVNNGTIQTLGTLADGVALAADSSLTNNGLIIAEGGSSEGVQAFGQGVTVTNSVTGSIITSGELGIGVLAVDGVSITNDGLIQTFGQQSHGINVADNAVIANSGNLVTSGQRSTAIIAGNGAQISNSGLIETTGALANALNVGDDAVIANSGTIATQTDGSAGVTAGANAQIDNSGSISTLGNNFSDAVVLGGGSTLNNSGSISAEGSDSFGVFGAGNLVSITNSATGSIITSSDGGFAVSMLNDSSITNDGQVATTGNFAFALDLFENGIVVNNGTVSTAGESAAGVNVGAGSSVENNGSISTAGTDSIAIIAEDLSQVTIGASGTVTTLGDNAGGIVMLGDATFSNAGAISTQGAGAQGVSIVGDASFANSGSIATQNADAVAIGGTADVSNSATGSITATGGDAVRIAGDDSSLVNDGSIRSTDGAGLDVSGANNVAITNNGLIEGNVGIVDTSAPGSGDQMVLNFGTITGLGGAAVQLGDGNDEFRHFAGGSVNGNVSLEGGDDTFALQGSASSVNGTIDGGAGNDLAIIGGTLDADNFAGFESFQIGSDLEPTLADATIVGDRVLDGDVTVAGGVTLGLGVDSLTSTGAMTLENTATVTIETPLDAALVGQTVTVLQEGTTFTDNGAAFVVVDDDLLLDYTPVVGSLAVTVNSVDPLAASGDANVVAFGTALNGAVNSGSISQDNFDLLNGLPDATALEAAALDALPALNGGEAREIFEASSAASSALNRHLDGEDAGVWGEVIIRGADQDGSSLSDGGYESDQKILTVGGDFALGDMARAGILASYAEIDNDDFTGAGAHGETEVESIKLGAYAGVDIGDRGYVNAELAYLTGSVENRRFGQFSAIASEYDFDGFAYSAEIGFDVLDDDEISLTPSAGINGASLSFDDAVETGGFGFTVNRDDADFLELRGGVDLAGEFSSGISAYVGGTYVYDLEDDARSFNLTSAELGTFAVGLPTREQSRFELEAGAALEVTENFKIEVGYLGDFASGYDAHAAKAGVRIAF